jgi:ParB/RepB/Spo0J family partition protein
MIAKNDAEQRLGAPVEIDAVKGYIYEFDPFKVMMDPDNPRKQFRRINQLALSIKTLKQQAPGKVTLIKGNPDFLAKLVDGERRLRACRIINEPFRAFVDEESLTPAERLRQALGANFNAEPHDPIEIAKGLHELLEKSAAEGKPMSQEELGAGFGHTGAWAGSYLGLLKLAPEVQAMIVPTDSDERETSDLPEPEEAQQAEKEDAEPRSKRRRTHLPYAIALKLLPFTPEMQIKTGKTIISKNMSMVQARRFIAKQASKLGIAHRTRMRSPTEAADSFWNKLQNTGDAIGYYTDMTFPILEQMFSTTEARTLTMYIDKLNDLREQIEGLGVSLAIVRKHKIPDKSKGSANGQSPAGAPAPRHMTAKRQL